MIKPKPTKLLNKEFLILIFISLITAMGFGMISTLISPYAVSFGSELSMAGVISGVFSITALLFRPLGGIITDSLNKKTLCVVTTFITALLMFGYSLSAGLWPLLAVRVLHGAMFGVSGTANLALATEFIPDDKMGQGLGYYGLGQVLSQIIGPNMGIAIKDTWGYGTLFIGIALLTALAGLILLVAFPYEYTAPKTEKSAQRAPFSLDRLIAKECIFYALIAGLFSMGNGIVSSFLVLAGEARHIPNIALFFSANAIVLFLLRLLTGTIIDKANLILIVNLSLVTSAVSMVLIGKSTILPIILVAGALKALGNVGGQISLQSACVKKVDAAKIGIATSTYYIGADIGQGLGPIWGGKIAQAFGYEAVFYCMGAIFLIAVAIFTVYQRRTQRAALAG